MITYDDARTREVAAKVGQVKAVECRHQKIAQSYGQSNLTVYSMLIGKSNLLPSRV